MAPAPGRNGAREQLGRLKELESEAPDATGSTEMPTSPRLRKAVSDPTLDTLVLAEAAQGNV
ncbi:MAG: hypothetical protein AAGI50_09945 [Pseudomonadota bacterium]